LLKIIYFNFSINVIVLDKTEVLLQVEVYSA